MTLKPPYIHPTSIVEPRVQVGWGTSVWAFCHLMKDCTIGAECSIGAYCQIDEGVRIPKLTRIGNGVWVFRGVHLEPDVFIGRGVRFTNDKYPRNRKRNWTPEVTNIETGVAIGAGAIILPGVRIGYGAIIGAGAIVTKDVPYLKIVKGKW